MNSDEREMLRNSVTRLIDDHWVHDAARTNTPMLYRVWDALRDIGAADIGKDGETGKLREAAIVANALGHAACPVPFAPMVLFNLILGQLPQPSAIADRIVAGGGRVAIALGAFDGDRQSGSASFAENVLNGTVRFVESHDGARHMLVWTAEGIALIDADAAGVSVASTPGLSVPPLSDITFANVPAHCLPIKHSAMHGLAAAARLLLVARAQGAASRALKLVIDHVGTRRQFEQPLAAFQAVQHKLADCALAIDASDAMICDAAEAHDANSADWPYHAAAASAFAGLRLRQAILEIHHTFGAIGYSEEHEAPRHFRLIHADVTRMGGIRQARAFLADWILSGEHSELPDLDMGAAAAAARTEARTWLADHWTAEMQADERRKPFKDRGWNETFGRSMGAAGWLGISWPKAFGGQGRTPFEQLAFAEEFNYADAPGTSVSAASWIVAPEILRHGSPELQKMIVPALHKGEVSFALGYSEPEAGSDLASLRTTAVQDGDDYVINGQKLWGTGTDKANYVILAARTDPEAEPKHAGISLFVVPLNSPGIEIVPAMAMYGHSFCAQFYDDVRVPATYRLGPENSGWAILAGALASERILMGGNIARIRRLFEEMCTLIRSSVELRDDRAVRDMIGQLAGDIEAARRLVVLSVRALEAGRLPLVEGAMTKVFSGDLAERMSEIALDIFGTSATLGEESATALLDGRIEQALRRSLMMVIGGGAAEIQRNIIAQRGLKLGR